MPPRPAERKLLVHQAFEPLRAECFDTLCLLCLEPLLCQPLELCLHAPASEHGIARLLELLGQFVNLGIKRFLLLLRLCLVESQALGNRHGLSGSPDGIPVLHPVRVGLNEPWLRQTRAGFLEQIALAHLLGPHVVPTQPAQGELLIHQPLDAELAQMLHTLLTLRLELLLQLIRQAAGAVK